MHDVYSNLTEAERGNREQYRSGSEGNNNCELVRNTSCVSECLDIVLVNQLGG